MLEGKHSRDERKPQRISLDILIGKFISSISLFSWIFESRLFQIFLAHWVAPLFSSLWLHILNIALQPSWQRSRRNGIRKLQLGAVGNCTVLDAGIFHLGLPLKHISATDGAISANLNHCAGLVFRRNAFRVIDVLSERTPRPTTRSMVR